MSLMRVEKVPDSTYETIGGLEKQVKEIKEVIELPIKHPEIFESLGIAQPKGVLLYGPPGTGKTLLARAVAHHTDCCFIRVSGSELVQKYIGEGSRMVRELFVMAREHAPSIIFMDEVDSIGSSRIEGSEGGDSEVQRTMLELLNQACAPHPSTHAPAPPQDTPPSPIFLSVDAPPHDDDQPRANFLGIRLIPLRGLLESRLRPLGASPSPTALPPRILTTPANRHSPLCSSMASSRVRASRC